MHSRGRLCYTSVPGLTNRVFCSPIRNCVLAVGNNLKKSADFGNPLRGWDVFIGKVKSVHAKPAWQYSLCFAAVPVVAGFYRGGGAYAGPGDRWDHGNIHIDPCGNAAVPAGFRSRKTLPGG